MQSKMNKKGFTVVELVIVIAVIAILAAVLIPTFSSLIRKANESVDIQLVRQMNTILQTDETVNGKPASIEGVKAVLAENGIVDYTPALADNAFAWDKGENIVILMDKTTQKGIFPEEYKDVDYVASTWVIFGGTVNVPMSDLGANIDEALANAKPGQTIVLSSDQTLTIAAPSENVNLDLNGKKLTLVNTIDGNGSPLAENGVWELSNGTVEASNYLAIATGANLVLKDIDWTTTSTYAIHLENHASRVDITGGTIIADVPIGTSFSSGTSRHVIANLTGVQLGTQANPCNTGISMITSGDVTVTNCTIYATEKCVYNRAGNMTIQNSTMNYQPTADYVDTYLGNEGPGYPAPAGIKSWHWLGGTSGVNAPIVVGDFRAKHYSADANCTLVKVTINCANSTYPNVYLSQENYDVIDRNTGIKSAGTVIMKTRLTCDNTITWAVNPGKNDAFVADCVDQFADYANYAGYEYSGSGHNGTALLYVDNIFVNGVEQAPGSTSANPIPAN